MGLGWGKTRTRSWRTWDFIQGKVRLEGLACLDAYVWAALT